MLVIQKKKFIARLGWGISSRSGFAAGKLGESEKKWMLQPIVRGQPQSDPALRAYGLSLKFHAFNQSALFPPDPEFYVLYNAFYIPHVRNLDALGLFGAPTEPLIMEHYALDVPVMSFRHQEPDRSVPYDPALCYLQFFRDKRILIVTSQADILAQRANKETFEAVWRKIGKPWFYPASVEALSFPYGWSPRARAQYGNSLRLFDSLAANMANREFDVALITAGGLGIPLASEAKRNGKVGLSLGGHLQALFGVIGRRWREQQEWLNRYVTDAWIDMPDPRAGWIVPGADGGAYW